MSRIRIATLAFALAAAVAAPLALAASDGGDTSIDKVNGSIDAEAGHRYGSLDTVNGSIRIATGAVTGSAQTVNGSIKAGDNVHSGVETVNGGVFIDHDGQVAKGVTTVNGAIGIVQTVLGGGIETVSGDITVGRGSHVKGGIHVEKPGTNWFPISIGTREPPRIIIGPNAVVDGPLVFERDVKLYVHGSARIGHVTGATAVRYSGDLPPRD